MSVLASLLEQEGRKRGLLPDGGTITAESAFLLVRDMPYRRASSRKPEAIVEEWQGTCSGKHYLLADIFRELGADVRVMMCTHRFTPENTRHFPADLQAVVVEGCIPDVHTYLEVDMGHGWTVVDATWPSSAEALGMIVNRWIPACAGMTGGMGADGAGADGACRDMAIACDPIDTWRVPADNDPQEFKEQLIQEFCGVQSRERDDFINGLGRWLSENT